MRNIRLPFGIKETLSAMRVTNYPTIYYDEGKTITQLRKEFQTVAELLCMTIETEKCLVTYDLNQLKPVANYALLVWRRS